MKKYTEIFQKDADRIFNKGIKYRGKECKKCGSVIRYKKGNSCVACTKKRTDRYEKVKRIDSEKYYKYDYYKDLMEE